MSVYRMATDSRMNDVSSVASLVKSVHISNVLRHVSTSYNY